MSVASFGLATLISSTTLLGCGTSSDGDALPAASLNPPVSKETEQDAKETVERFSTALREGKTADAAAVSAPNLDPKQISAEMIDPFKGGSPVEIDSVQSAQAGKQTVVRVHFTGTNGKVYRTNFVLKTVEGKIVVDSFLVPTFASKPVASGQSQASL